MPRNAKREIVLYGNGKEKGKKNQQIPRPFSHPTSYLLFVGFRDGWASHKRGSELGSNVSRMPPWMYAICAPRPCAK